MTSFRLAGPNTPLGAVEPSAFEDERSYGGPSAVVLGALWVVLGAGVVVFSLAPESSGALIGLLRRVGRLYLES